MLYGLYLEYFDLAPFFSFVTREDKATQTKIRLQDTIIVVLDGLYIE